MSPAAARNSSSVHSKLSATSSDDSASSASSAGGGENSDSSSSSGSEASIKDNKKVKSDKNKNDTLRKLFSWGNKGEGGAKGKGQVVIVDHSEDAQQQHQQQHHQHTQSKENSIPNEKLLSPYSYNNHTKSSILSGSNYANAPLVNGISTGDVSPLKPNNSGNSSLNRNQFTPNSQVSMICKINLSRLSRIPPEVSYRINRNRSPMGSDGRRSATQFSKRDDDRLPAGRSPIEYNHSGNGRRSRACNVDDDVNSRLSNSRDSSSSSTTTSSKHRDGSDRNSGRYELNDTAHLGSTNERNKHNNNGGNANGSFNTIIHNNIESRLGHVDPSQYTIRNSNYLHSPKTDEKPMSKIKRESLKNEFNSDYGSAYGNTMTSPKPMDDKNHAHQTNFNNKINYGNNCTNGGNNNIKRENIKVESAYVDNNCVDDSSKLIVGDDFVANNRKKRSSSANSSPYKDKKRKKLIDDPLEQPILPPTNHDRLDVNLLPPPQKQQVTKVYVSYFERTNDERDEIR